MTAPIPAAPIPAAPIPTDAELIAAINRTARPATFVKFACGDARLVRAVVEVDDVVRCVDCDLDIAVTGVIPTQIV